MYKELVTDVFFDLDHTLWDFEKNSALTFEHILKAHEIEVDLEEFLGVYVPINHAYWKLYRENKITKKELRHSRLKNTFNALDYEIGATMIHKLSEAYIEHLPNHGYLFEGSIEILEYLKPKYQLHIITNGFEEVQHLKMKSSGIHTYFKHVINSEMVGVKKPDPKIFKHALDMAVVEPHKSIMIGDNLEADIQGAINMGMNALHFNSNHEENHNHTQIINSLTEIKRYL